MAGIETVGLVLGILPLIISAAEHYEDVFTPFKRYRKFAPELQIFQQQIGTQKTIFRNECHLLLASFTCRQIAQTMLKDAKHPSWIDSSMDEKLVEQLGDSASTCKIIIEQIESKLSEVQTESEGFGLVIQQSIPVRLRPQFSINHPELIMFPNSTAR